MNQNSKQTHINQTLADFLKNGKDLSQVTQLKIAIANRPISSIGKGISSKYTGITHLLLSNNHLTSLSGIEAFPNLTHLSIALNDIESIEEMNKIFNKYLIVSLSVKKNFFLKNPQANIDLINLFPNIKYLDGFKISEATHKVISESQSVSFQIMTYAIMIQQKVEEVNRLYSMIKMNDEFIRKKANGMNSIEDIDKMIDQIKTLLKLNKVKLLKEDYINKYLVSHLYYSLYQSKNINPSVHVLKKIMHNSGLCEDKNNERRINHEEFFHCYEALFSEIITLYEAKNNYTELPFYLNYLILKDNPILIKFFMQKLRQQPDYNNAQENSNDKSYIETVSSICKELSSLFTYYTNYSVDILTKYQLMYFYQINKQSDTLYGYHPTAEDMMIYFDQGNEKISMDGFNRKVCLFLSNIECDSFPVFSLNFDYMRSLTTVIQNRINEYRNKTDKILYFIQLLNERKKMFFPQKQNENELFKYHFASNNMKVINKEDHSQKIRANKFNHSDKASEYYQSKSKCNSNSKSNSQTKSRSKSKDNNQYNSHSSDHITYDNQDYPIAKSANNDNIIHNTANKERSRSNDNDFLNSNNNLRLYTNNYPNSNNIPFIVKPNEQFTLANNDDNLTIEEVNKSNASNTLQKEVQFQSQSNPLVNSDNYNPSQKNGSDIIQQIKKENRTNNLIKRYIKYHNAFVALDVITRLAPMKTFITRLSLKAIQQKLPFFISAIETFQLNLTKKRFLYDLWSINQRYFIIKHHLFLSSKRKIMKVLKENKKISIHLKRGYYGLLLSKAFFALNHHKAKCVNKKKRYNRVTYYYYNKLIKKVWLIIKFHHQMEKEKENCYEENKANEYPEGKYSNQCYDQTDSEYAKVFNFFHKEEDDNNNQKHLNNNTDYSSSNAKKMIKDSLYSTFDKKDIIIEEEQEIEDNQHDNIDSINQLNSLIYHLEDRLHSITKAKGTKSKFNKEKEREKCLFDIRTKGSYNSKGRNKQQKKKNISNDTCPYCVSGIDHDKCVGNTNNTEHKSSSITLSNSNILLLGAPNYIRNTSGFVHKNLK